MTDHIHQAFHIEGVTDPKVQEEKIARTGEFGFLHHHREDEQCNPGCHAINPTNPKGKKG